MVLSKHVPVAQHLDSPSNVRVKTRDRRARGAMNEARRLLADDVSQRHVTLVRDLNVPVCLQRGAELVGVRSRPCPVVEPLQSETVVPMPDLRLDDVEASVVIDP